MCISLTVETTVPCILYSIVILTVRNHLSTENLIYTNLYIRDVVHYYTKHGDGLKKEAGSIHVKRVIKKVKTYNKLVIVIRRSYIEKINSKAIPYTIIPNVSIVID